MSALLESVHYDTIDRDEAMRVAGERIEADADKVRELVEDNLDATDSPVMSNDWTAGLLIALRESKLLLKSLCEGDTLEQAMAKHPGGIDHFRTLLRCADTSDAWIATLIDQAAEKAVDAMGDDE